MGVMRDVYAKRLGSTSVANAGELAYETCSVSALAG
ncbi:MAG: hypothetical protein ACJAYE_001296 [Candidatus Azotimanducaceae bacterium]|jgi:hypothetical protein